MLSRKIYKFCKNGFRITSKAQNRKLVASCIFLTLTLAGCQNIQPTEPVSTSVPTKETIEDESKAEAEKYRNIIDVEDIAAWKQVAGNIVVPEENYFTADLKKLVERLSTGNLTVEAFTQEGNRYFEMVYQERGE